MPVWAATTLGLPQPVRLALPLDRDDREQPGGRRAIKFTGEVRIASHPEKARTLVAMCDVEGAGELYAEVGRRLGVTIPEPPYHVTLYTEQPDGPGIRVATAAEYAATTRVPKEDAAAVLAAAGL